MEIILCYGLQFCTYHLNASLCHGGKFKFQSDNILHGLSFFPLPSSSVLLSSFSNFYPFFLCLHVWRRNLKIGGFWRRQVVYCKVGWDGMGCANITTTSQCNPGLDL